MAASGLSYASPSLPPGWSWHEVREDPAIAILHRTMMEVFANGPPGVNIPAMDVFSASYAEKPAPDQLLYCGDQVAGFIDLKLNGNIGIINTIGRVPSFRAQGFGRYAFIQSYGAAFGS